MKGDPGLEGELSATVRHSLVFGLGGVVSGGLGFVLIPVYARHLRAGQFGVLSLLLVVLTLVGVALRFGLNHAFFREYSMTSDPYRRRRLIGSTFVFLLLSSAGLTLALQLLAPEVSALIFSGDPSRARLVRWVVGIAFFDALTVVPYAILQAQLRSVAYSAMVTSGFAVQLSSIVGLVLMVDATVENVLIGRLVGVVYEALLGLWLARKQLNFQFAVSDWAEMLAFGVPLVFGQILLALFFMIDRFFLERYAGAKELGIYAISNQLVRVVPILVTAPFGQVWAVTRYSVAKGGNARLYYSRSLTGIVFASTFLALGVAAVGGDGLRLFGLRGYWPAATIIPLLALSTVFDAAARVLNVGITLKGRTLFSPFIAGAALIVNIILNFALIPGYGAMGATISTLLSFACFCALRFSVSNLFLRVGYEWGRIGKAIGIGTAMIASFYLVDHLRGPAPSRAIVYLCLLAKTLVALSFPICLLALGFLKEGELEAIRKQARQALRVLGLGTAKMAGLS